MKNADREESRMKFLLVRRWFNEDLVFHEETHELEAKNETSAKRMATRRYNMMKGEIWWLMRDKETLAVKAYREPWERRCRTKSDKAWFRLLDECEIGECYGV